MGRPKVLAHSLALVLLGLALALPLAATAQQAGRPAAGVERTGSAPPGFWEAIRLDDVGKLQTEMLRGASANARHPEYGPAIVFAARDRSPKTLAFLAGLSGTALNAEGPNGETALMLSALHGDLDAVRLLVARGAQVNRPGWTPLHYAAANGHLQVIDYLLEQHAFIDAESPNGTTPLMMAARHKHGTVLRALVEAGADPTQRNEAGMSAADYLAANGEADEAQWLSERVAEFVARYGTVENPRPVGRNVPLAPAGSSDMPTEGAAGLSSGISPPVEDASPGVSREEASNESGNTSRAGSPVVIEPVRAPLPGTRD